MLTSYHERYEEIMASKPSHERDVELAKLMTEMENHFRINVFREPGDCSTLPENIR